MEAGKASPQQLLLGVKPDLDTSFDNFKFAAANRQLERYLRESMVNQGGQLLYLWGRKSSGKSHLLQALCNEFTTRGLSCIYLPLRTPEFSNPAFLKGLESLHLVCLDDLEAVLTNPLWENALFSFYNRIRDTQTSLFITARAPVHQASVDLPDLRSRLQQAIVFQLSELKDSEKASLVKSRALQMGIELSDTVVDFIMLRSNREVPELLALIARLDQKSLEQKRKITVPLIKQVMGW